MIAAPGAIDAQDAPADHGGTAEGRGRQPACAKMVATTRPENNKGICTGFFAASAGQRHKFESPVRVRWACSAVASACAVRLALFDMLGQHLIWLGLSQKKLPACALPPDTRQSDQEQTQELLEVTL
jgi:hypothetical protein